MVRKRKSRIIMQEKESNPQQLEVVLTNDGSATLYHPEIGEHYHSHHGALQEAKHVFLASGLQYFLDKDQTLLKDSQRDVAILEVGFGTGLNYLLTADYCRKNKINLHYTSLERFPLSSEIIQQTGYADFVEKELAASFYKNYEELLPKQERRYSFDVSANNTLELIIGDALNFKSEQRFDVLYFDAFSAIHQPEMWIKELLEPLCNLLKPGGVFITYAITGNLKRLIKSLGFEIEKVPGAPGKREMLRAVRLQ